MKGNETKVKNGKGGGNKELKVEDERLDKKNSG